MIHYRLRCSGSHSFEGWFRDSTTFEAQAAAGEISCPTCNDTHVDRAPMAPRVAKSNDRPSLPAPDPAVLREMLRSIRRSVEANCEHVGAQFAEEARKIHYGETEARNIYGGATADEVSGLIDEGIEFQQIPWIPESDA